jgi:hypothetical protein
MRLHETVRVVAGPSDALARLLDCLKPESPLKKLFQFDPRLHAVTWCEPHRAARIHAEGRSVRGETRLKA